MGMLLLTAADALGWGSEQPLLQEGLFGMAGGRQMEYFLARLLES